MSLRYAIAESLHRWLILAGISFVAGLVGTIAIITYGWSHALASLWIYAGLLLTAVFLVRALLDWAKRADAALRAAEEQERRQAGKKKDL